MSVNGESSAQRTLLKVGPLLGGFTGNGGVLGGDDFPFPVALEPSVSPDETAESFGLPLELASRAFIAVGHGENIAK